MDKITFNFRIDRQTRDQFKQIAEANGTNATTLLTQWINDYISANSKDSTASTDQVSQQAKTTVSAKHETTDMERIKDAETEELNKLWGAIFQHEKELRKLNAKMHRRKDEIDEKVNQTDLLDYFYGWSVPANQENSLDARIDKLEDNAIDRAELNDWAEFLPNQMLEPLPNQSQDISYPDDDFEAIHDKIDPSMSDEEKIEILASDKRWFKLLGSSNFDANICANFLTNLLAIKKIKGEDYNIHSNWVRAFWRDHFAQNRLTKQEKKLLRSTKGEGETGKPGKHHLAYKVFSRAIEIANKFKS